jgi:hypothetical protein
MHVSAKKISFLGLLLALTVVLVILGSVIEVNTLFLIAGASFCVGIAVRESGLKMGLGFYIASVLLNFFIAPNKFHCITFAALGLYIFLIEFVFHRLTYATRIKNRKRLFWIIKYIIFNIMYIPALLFAPKLVYSGQIEGTIVVGIFFAGQIILFIYDKVYSYFQRYIWGKLRIKLNIQ